MTRTLLVFLAISLLPACATTKVEKTWQDDSKKGTFSNVLVAAVLDFAPYRTLVEQEITYKLRAAGVDANAMVDVLGNTDDIGKEAAEAAIRQTGADSVLLVRPIGRSSETVHNPEATYVSANYAGGWFRYYTYSLRVVRTPEYDDTYATTEIETTLFDAPTEKRVWSATTKTTELKPSDALNSYIHAIGPEIRDSGLFGKR